jgi:hypothetical protein
MTTIAIPDRTEAAEYYFRYIDRVGTGDIRDILANQLPEALSFFRGISAEQSLQRYAPDKWSIRQVVGHLSDTEKLFAFRAFWFARGFDTPLPSFDQHVAVSTSGADGRSWDDLVQEFAALRQATIAFFKDLPEEAWTRRGTASGNPFSVRALAYLTAGHLMHHVEIVRERYLASANAK